MSYYLVHVILICVLLPCGSWSYWSAFSRHCSEGRTPPQWSALFLWSLLRGRRSDRPAPPRQSSDAAVSRSKAAMRHTLNPTEAPHTWCKTAVMSSTALLSNNLDNGLQYMKLIWYYYWSKQYILVWCASIRCDECTTRNILNIMWMTFPIKRHKGQGVDLSVNSAVTADT